jgi:hypothetical protein
MVNYHPTQFAIFRIILGLYLAWHFNSLIPYASEMFSQKGMIPDPSVIPTWRIFSYVNYGFESVDSINFFLRCLSVVSVMFALGFYRRDMATIMLYGWAYLFNRNVFIANPGIPYVGWLLLACIVIPNGEPYCMSFSYRSETTKRWYMPSIIYWAAWFIMVAGYTVSGLHKLQCPSWLDGSALRLILSSLLARDNFMVNFLLESPPIVLQMATWISLAGEILSLLLGPFYLIRKWHWLFFMIMHIGVIILVNFTDLTLGVMMIHIFTFEYRWLQEFPFNLISGRPCIRYKN